MTLKGDRIVESGKRISNEFSLFASEDPSKCPDGKHAEFRAIECGGVAGEDRDVIECSRCGKQLNVACTFDEDFS